MRKLWETRKDRRTWSAWSPRGHKELGAWSPWGHKELGAWSSWGSQRVGCMESKGSQRVGHDIETDIVTTKIAQQKIN